MSDGERTKPRTYQVQTSDYNEPLLVLNVVGLPREFGSDVAFPHPDETNTNCQNVEWYRAVQD